MTIYYFDVEENGELTPDRAGVECTDFNHAKKEAVRAIVDMTRDALPDGDHHELQLTVRDKSGAVVLEVTLNFDARSGSR
ncbi:hypothetical protein [Mesorhizobium sp. B2-4-19]|uniref:DUF6894 family protein n=1 Tax=Mesorhizobium sp. B2-4-19 TaxID=2589930 RepID=UPI0015E28DE1|nr:hypothetical protein [Mesorhizobium sp. B2-4-19]